MRTFGSFLATAHLATTGPVTVRCARRADAPASRQDAFVVKSFDALDAARPELFWLPDPAGARAAFLNSMRRQVRMAAASPRQWLAVHEQGDGPVPYYAADCIGLTLRKLVIWRTQLRHYALLHLTRSIVDALWDLQRNDGGGTHGNLKLTNVLLDGDGALERARVRLADPHPDPKARSEQDELHDVGRLIESLVLRRDAFAGVMSFEDRRPWDALGFRDGDRWRKLCNALREGECATLAQLRDVELRRFTTRRKVFARRLIGTSFAAAGIGAVVFMGVRYDGFDEARKALKTDENVVYVRQTVQRLLSEPPIATDDPTLAAFFALRPGLQALGPERELITGERSIDSFSAWRDYEAVRRAAAARAALSAAFEGLREWQKPSQLGSAAKELTGEGIVELNGLTKIPGDASYGFFNYELVALAVRYDAVLAQCKAFRDGTEANLLAADAKDLKIDAIEARVQGRWEEYVAAAQNEFADRLKALNAGSLPLPKSYASAFDAMRKRVRPEHFAKLTELRGPVDWAVEADAELFAAYRGLLDQQGDPLLEGLKTLLMRRLGRHQDDLARFAAECRALAASRAEWDRLASLGQTGALGRVPADQRDALAARAREIEAEFEVAPSVPVAMSALARWPVVLNDLRGLGEQEDLPSSALTAFEGRRASVQEAIDGKYAGAGQGAMLAQIERGTALIAEYTRLPKVGANLARIEAIKQDLAASNDALAALLKTANDRQELVAAAQRRVEEERLRKEAENNAIAKAALEKRLAEERARQEQSAEAAAFRNGLQGIRDQLPVAKMAESYATIGNALTTPAARDRWVKDVGPYLRDLAAYRPPQIEDAAFEAAAGQERRRLLEAEPAVARDQLAASPAGWKRPDPAQRMQALMAPWTRDAQQAREAAKSIDAALGGDREAKLEEIGPAADRLAASLQTLGVTQRLPVFDRLEKLRDYRQATASVEGAGNLIESILKSRVEFGLERQVVPPAWRALVDGDVDFLLDATTASGNPRAVGVLALLPEGPIRTDLLARLIAKVGSRPDEPKAADRWVALGSLHRPPERPLPEWVRFNATVAALRRGADAADGTVDAAALESLRKLAAEPGAPPQAAALFAEIEAARRPATPAGGAVPSLIRNFKLPGDATGFAVKVPLPGGRQEEELRVEFVRVGPNRYVSATEVPVLLMQALDAASVPKEASNAPLEYPFVDRAKAEGTWGPVTWTPLPAAAATDTRPVRVGGASGWWVSSPRLNMVIKPEFAEFINKPSWKSPLTFLSATSARAVAERLGFELPTPADWQRLQAMAGGGDFRQHAPAYNLRDATWAQQAARVQQALNAGITENNLPSRQSFQNKDKTGSYPFNDGALFFTDVDRGPVDAGLRNLIGNVAEYLAEPAAGGAFTYSIAGGSALSDPVADAGGLLVPVSAGLATNWTMRADVGFRLAFTAAPAADGPARRSPAEIIRGTRFLTAR